MHSIVPFLWFDGHAEAAASRYTGIFPDSHIDSVNRLPDGRTAVVEFTLFGQPYRAMDGGPGHPHTDAISFQVDVETQDELDRYWDALIADGGSPVACGWLTDPWGVSWQVTPRRLPELLGSADADARARVFAAMVDMVKIDIGALEAAAAGR